MSRYGRRSYGRRSRTGRRILPVLFTMMLFSALFMILGKALPGLPGDILVIRDEGASGNYIPAETDTDTDDLTAPDQVITGSLTDMAGRRTSFTLPAETGSVPVQTLIPVKTEENETEPAPETEPEAPPVIGLMERVPEDYDYTAPVPENDPVDITYMEDAVLVGDSRMQGLILYCGLARIKSYTYKGLTVDSVFTRPLIEWTEDPAAEDKVPAELWEDGKIPVMEALKRTDFTKVYIMLGINETGWADPADFPAVYGKMIDGIREANEQCLIYMLSVFPVSASASANHPYAKNDKIALYNQYLQELAAEKNVFFVDLAPAVVNENGVLPEDCGFDGIHLNKEYCMKVLDYMFSHTVPLLDESEVAADIAE